MEPGSKKNAVAKEDTALLASHQQGRVDHHETDEDISIGTGSPSMRVYLIFCGIAATLATLAFPTFHSDDLAGSAAMPMQVNTMEINPPLTSSHHDISNNQAAQTRVVSSVWDNKGLTCTVEECVDLLYSTGSNPKMDRPDHLRAASSMQWISETRMAIMQDDLNFIALVDIELNLQNIQSPTLMIKNAYSIALPRGRDGSRQFQHSRGNKILKLDLEASVYIPPRFSPLEEGFLLAFGSGSSKSGIRDVLVLVRDELLLVDLDVTPVFQAVNATFWEQYCEAEADFLGVHQQPSPLVVFHAPELYQSLRDRTAFSGSELNLEGASILTATTESPSATIRFLQRGNGAAKPQQHLYPKNAMGEIPANALFHYMDSLLERDGQAPLFFPNQPSKDDLAPPVISDVVEFHLGSVNGVDLTFTGSAPTWFLGNYETSIRTIQQQSTIIREDTEFVYIAGAEASPDATRDGAVVGTAMGIIHSIDYDNVNGNRYDGADVELGVYSYLTYPNGEPFLHKTEGVTIPPGQHRQHEPGKRGNRNIFALTVLDMDDPDVASQMCVVQMQFLAL